MSLRIFLLLILCPYLGTAQRLKLKERKESAMSGSTFAAFITDSMLRQPDREKLIFQEIRKGNIPPFYRKLITVKDSANIRGRLYRIEYQVLPDFLAIGSETDHFYCPMTPILAQRVARLLNCSLPTRKMSDRIFQAAAVKMTPQPIPPSAAMITVPVFLEHSRLIQEQRKETLPLQPLGSLVSGNKKDLVLSDRMYRDGKLRVVIYGWHREDGKPIQPLYNGHTADWADYSHGTRLILSQVLVNGKRTTVGKVLRSPTLHPLLSDEGPMKYIKYPVKQLTVKQVLLK
jgi:hypothetical protein